MKVKFNIQEFNNDLLKAILKTISNPAGLTKKMNNPKFIIIDWKDANLDGLNLSEFDKSLIEELILDYKWVNNREAWSLFFKFIELKNEEYLWNILVDDKRLISHEAYCNNTYDENLDLLFKNTKFILN